MLMWRKEGIFTVGATEGYAHAVVLSDIDKEPVHVTNRLTPEEFRQVADKLEEIQGKKEENGKVLLRLEKRLRGEEVIHVVYDQEGERIGLFAPDNLIGRDVFTKTAVRELSPAEAARIADFAKQLNFRL